MKRLLDIALAGAGLLVSAPALAALAIAVKIDSQGPAFFVQRRVGRGRRPIRVPKLRTMVVEAERRGLDVTAATDVRITRLGALLRRTKIDELPQLWSVLRGDMSIVGPRPEVERYAALYRPEWLAVFEVQPGITDPASLTFRDEERLLARANDRELAYVQVVMPLKLELALRGVRQQSLFHDIAVIARTAWAVLGPSQGQDPVIDEAERRIEELNQGTR
ncbi:MAG TPA: sugar transferase [Kofleriaceae bacterium]|jgi:lipopolysaccharide/colanic/teichoic acid biosynthesis glycosyltransferase